METIQNLPTDFMVGIILCLIGLLFCYIVGKRRFNRRGIGGLQHYNSYGEALITSTIERLVKLAGIAAIIVGLLFMVTSYPHHDKKNGKPQNKATNQTKSNKHGN